MSAAVVPLTGVSPRALAERNQKAAVSPAASVWVSASAGSGKTTVLTRRVLALLLTGTAPNRILCLTFTKAAAAEMSNRVAERLAHWVTATEDELYDDLRQHLTRDPTPEIVKRARSLFAEVLEAPGGLQISTLHAFCQSLLRRFPLEAGVAPHFTLVDERDSEETLAQALEDTLAAAREGQNPALGDAMAVITARVHETHFNDLLGEVVRARGKLAHLIADADGKMEPILARLAQRLSVAAGETDETLLQAAVADTAFARADLVRAAAAMDGGSDKDRERAADLRLWLASADRVGTFETYLRLFLTAEGQPRKNLITKAACKSCPEAAEIMAREADRLAALEAKRRSVGVCVCSGALLQIGAHVLERYRLTKAQRNWIDYDDLIQKARQLLERPDFAAWVLFKLDGGIDHVLVDEAQDTNPDQWAILQALTSEFFVGEGARELTRTMFAVGDRKQSIYSFQGAAPDEFDRMEQHVQNQVEATGAEWASVTLNVSFRSVKAVLAAVDAVFANPLVAAGVVGGSEPLSHLPAREGAGGLVEVWPLVEPSTQDDLPTWKPPIERTAGDVPELRLAALVAKRIAQMVKDRELLVSQGRPIRPGDIMILVRRRTAFVEELVRRLKQADIAVAGVDRMVLTEQLAVMDLMALGRFLLLPADDLTLATVLKGPLLGLTEEELFTLAYGRGDRTVWGVLKSHAGAESAFGSAHRFLEDLLARTDYATPAELYAHILVTGDGRRKLLARLGEEADDPIDEFLRLTLAYQETHPPSLEGFLHWLERGQTEIKRDLDQTGVDAVRVITVHGAKGLQAPIVFLPDTATPPTMRPKLMWTDDAPPLMLWPPRADAMDDVCRGLRDAADELRDEEYRRLLYVAMTRAEDRLYICGWRTRRPGPLEKTWYGMIRSGLEGLAGVDVTADPFFAADTALPGAEVLRLTCPQTASPKEPKAAPVKTETRAMEPWMRDPAPPEETPPRPLAPSQAARSDPPAQSPLADQGLRFQRGLIIHRLLQSLPNLPIAQRGAAAEAFVKRPSWGLPADVQGALVAETLAVLNAPDFAPLFGPGSRAEVPISGLVHGHAIAGQVDRLAVTDAEVMVIDYKTNRPPPRRAMDVDPAYVFQMAVYRATLQRIYPGRTVRCVLLWTDGPFTLEIAPEQLDAALAPLVAAAS